MRVDEAPGGAFAELFALVGNCHVDHAWLGPGRGLTADCVLRDYLRVFLISDPKLETFNYYLGVDEIVAEYYFDAVKEAITNNHHTTAPGDPSLAGRYCFDHWSRGSFMDTLVLCLLTGGGWFGPPGSSPVLRVVMDEHVLGVGQQVGLNIGRGANGDLEAAHIARVASVFQAVLIALQKALHVIPDL